MKGALFKLIIIDIIQTVVSMQCVLPTRRVTMLRVCWV